MNIYFYIFFFVISTSLAYAYWDPGTGSAIIQAILALLGSIVVYLGIFKQKIKYIIKKLGNIFKKKNTKIDGNK